MAQTAQLEQLLEHYKLTEPVSAEARSRLTESRKRVLRRSLKEAGEYSLWYGLVLFVVFLARKLGLRLTFIAAKGAALTMALVSAGAIIAGGYSVALKALPVIQSLMHKNEISEPLIKKEGLHKKKEEPLSIIRLYNGRVYRGFIESRGETFEVRTSEGLVSIPGKMIKEIRPAEQ